ncbi:MAG: peptidylprolyl isomerase [Bacteroidia bacterium]|nr:peptidylprolyl isomerase [Bacteroidia bacterium]
MISRKNSILFKLVMLLVAYTSVIQAQENVIDRVIAVVGTNVLLQSELDSQFQQYQSQPDAVITTETKCKLMEELLYQKLLLAQAIKDSLTITEGQIEQELDRRLRFYIQQFGSEERFTEFYGKSVDDFKTDLRDDVKNLLLAQQMQSKIVGNVTVTPNEVLQYFNAIHPDSLPFINAEVEIGQIVKKPTISVEAKKAAKEKIEDIRARIVSGKTTFAAMAGLYSEDPGSSNKGGLYEGIQRGQFVPEWDAMAFTIKPYEVSPVFETVYGYFIIQLIERRGEEVDARSLLIAPKVDASDLLKAKMYLDTVYMRLAADTVSFSDAAARYSSDDETKYNGGLMINPYSGSTKYDMEELGQIDQNLAFSINNLKVGEYTKPMPFGTRDGKQAYRILYLKSQSAPHKANLKDDYQTIQNAATVKKQQQLIEVWTNKKINMHYIKIADDFKSCTFNSKWVN